MITLSKTDGGRLQEGFTHEYNDCGVRALALSTAITYREAHQMLKSQGRRDRRGTKLTWIEACLTTLQTRGLRVSRVQSGQTLDHFISFNRTGRFLIITNKHGLTLIDGVIHDAGEISGARSRVKVAFRIDLPIPSPEVKPVITQDQINTLWERLNKLEAR